MMNEYAAYCFMGAAFSFGFSVEWRRGILQAHRNAVASQELAERVAMELEALDVLGEVVGGRKWRKS